MSSSETILLVEDSPDDALATQRAFKKAGLANPIRHCTDGDQALDYLFRRGEFTDAEANPLPGLILLDLNLPGTNGVEVLAQIKQDDTLSKIPVIVLTTSSDERDINDCYTNGANSYVVKPVDFPGFLEAIQRLTDFWFEIVVLPKGE